MAGTRGGDSAGSIGKAANGRSAKDQAAGGFSVFGGSVQAAAMVQEKR
jgi:hypothetical protein